MLIATTLLMVALQQTPAKPPQLPPCDTRPQASQFDFWVGEWDVIVKGKPAGVNRIEKILNGCVLQENWKGPGEERARAGTGMTSATVSGTSCGWTRRGRRS